MIASDAMDLQNRHIGGDDGRLFLWILNQCLNVLRELVLKTAQGGY